MYKWIVKLNIQIDECDSIIEPDMIKLKYVINADNFSEALMEAYNDVLNSEISDWSGRVTNIVVKQIGRN